MSLLFHLAVCTGHFQPLHHGQLALINQALALAPRCLVILEGAHAARSPRHPFTWQERMQTIRQALSEADRQRVEFVAVRELYDRDRRASAVRNAVRNRARTATSVALVAHLPDDSSVYFREFPGWILIDPGRRAAPDGSELREKLFGGASAQQALAAIQPHVPAATLAFLREWSCSPHCETMRAQWRAIHQERAKWAGSPYPPVFVTVNVVLQAAGHVLLIRRGAEPGKGRLALPGGFLEQRETIYASALRELQEETTSACLRRKPARPSSPCRSSTIRSAASEGVSSRTRTTSC